MGSYFELKEWLRVGETLPHVHLGKLDNLASPLQGEK